MYTDTSGGEREVASRDRKMLSHGPDISQLRKCKSKSQGVPPCCH